VSWEAEAPVAETGELPEGIDAVIELGVVANVMRYDREELQVQAGQTIRIDFTNTDNMEHNLLIISPGTLADIGRLADEMITAPDGRQRQYVPDSAMFWPIHRCWIRVKATSLYLRYLTSRASTRLSAPSPATGGS
jgi:plastocyanin